MLVEANPARPFLPELLTLCRRPEASEAGDPGACCAAVGVSPVCRGWCGGVAEADLSYSAEICAIRFAEQIMG